MTLPRESLSHMVRGLYHNERPEVTTISGSFTIGVGGGVAVTQTAGQGSAVTRTGAGDYLVTLTDTDIEDVISATACVQDTAGAHTDLIARAEDVTLGPPTTVVIESYAAAVATDALAANDLAIHYEITYQRAQQVNTDPREFYHHVTDAVMLCGGVDIGAGGAVDAHHGHGFTMTRTGAGDFLLTFDDAFNGFLGGHVNAGNAAGAGGDLAANFGAFTAGAAGAATLQVCTQVAAVSTDPANGGRINFRVYLYSEASGA